MWNWQWEGWIRSSMELNETLMSNNCTHAESEKGGGRAGVEVRMQGGVR
jgi:hypothetical protein